MGKYSIVHCKSFVNCSDAAPPGGKFERQKPAIARRPGTSHRRISLSVSGNSRQKIADSAGRAAPNTTIFSKNSHDRSIAFSSSRGIMDNVPGCKLRIEYSSYGVRYAGG